MKPVIFYPLPEEPEIVSESHFTWTIEKWRELPKKVHSPPFEACGHKWYVLRHIFEHFGTLVLTAVGVCYSFPVDRMV